MMQHPRPPSLPPRIAFLTSLLLLGIVVCAQYITACDASFTLFYLIPIATAAWFNGFRTGLLFCIAAAAATLLLRLSDQTSLAMEFWNTGIRFGVFSICLTLILHLKSLAAGARVLRKMIFLTVVCIASASALAAMGWIVQRELSVSAVRDLEIAPAAPEAAPSLAQLASLVETAVRSSRPILLGSRDPKGVSCVSVVRSGDVKETVPAQIGDVNGGPGTTIATLYGLDRTSCKSAMQDYAWHQNRLRTFLENEAVVNRPAAQRAHRLAEQARRFDEAAAAWTRLPPDLSAVEFHGNGDWLGYCTAQLNQAAAEKNLAGVKRWAGELDSAAFALDDLHRWLDFLVANYLTALDFQRECRSLFQAMDARHTEYNAQMTISYLPAGILCSNGIGNYTELERQAERLFFMPPDRLRELSHDQHLTPGSLWVAPGIRECFCRLQSVLSPENRKTWEAAARTPYEHSYLTNMLFRTWQTRSVDDLCAALKKFDAVYPRASVHELMSVLMYRGHSFAGLEWNDRYQTKLRAAAAEIGNTESDLEALFHACRWTHTFYRSPDNYGPTFTLRDALQQRKLDCVRATDMIGAIFRNAGRPRFGHVRWCCETSGHTVAAYLGRNDGKDKTMLVDALTTIPALEVWPDCYFHGHDWPPSLENNTTPYAAELYLRGLDSYIWAEGYIVRGPHAGRLTVAAVPYLPSRQETSTRKVFAGPYPQ
jgi:hypothetical protein